MMTKSPVTKSTVTIEPLSLAAEVGQLDCRLIDRAGVVRHFCILVRVDADTVEIRGVTFAISRSLITEFITAARAAGFKHIQYERTGSSGQIVRRIKYDMDNKIFIKKEIIK